MDVILYAGAVSAVLLVGGALVLALDAMMRGGER